MRGRSPASRTSTASRRRRADSSSFKSSNDRRLVRSCGSGAAGPSSSRTDPRRSDSWRRPATPLAERFAGTGELHACSDRRVPPAARPRTCSMRRSRCCGRSRTTTASDDRPGHVHRGPRGDRTGPLRRWSETEVAPSWRPIATTAATNSPSRRLSGRGEGPALAPRDGHGSSERRDLGRGVEMPASAGSRRARSGRTRFSRYTSRTPRSNRRQRLGSAHSSIPLG